MHVNILSEIALENLEKIDAKIEKLNSFLATGMPIWQPKLV